MLSDYECESACSHRERLEASVAELSLMLHTLVAAWNAPDIPGAQDYSWAVQQAMAMLPRYPLTPEITGLPPNKSLQRIEGE